MNYLLIPLIFLGVFLIFFWSHRQRNLKTIILEITPANKEKDKGLTQYREEIISFLKSLRYQEVEKSSDHKIFRPRPLQRIMGGDISISWGPYLIKIEGPKYIVLIIYQMYITFPV